MGEIITACLCTDRKDAVCTTKPENCHACIELVRQDAIWRSSPRPRACLGNRDVAAAPVDRKADRWVDVVAGTQNFSTDGFNFLREQEIRPSAENKDGKEVLEF